MSQIAPGMIVTIGAGHPCAGEKARIVGPSREIGAPGMWAALLVGDGTELNLLPRYIAVIPSVDDAAPNSSAKGKPAGTLFEEKRIA